MAEPHLSPYSGSWYPGGRAELNRLLDSLFAGSRERTGPWLPPGARGYVVPHAGPQYSGTVAAAVYRSLEQEPPQRVVLLAFSHSGGPRAVALPEIESIVTPLGETRVDTAFLERLAACPPFLRVPEERVCDHSAEIQLPFLQRAAPHAAVAPLYVGALDSAQREAAAEALAAAWEPGTVFLASSDLTHYGQNFRYQPFPVDADTAWRLHDLDFDSIEATGSLDAGQFLHALKESGDTVCGVAPISLLLETLSRLGVELYVETLDYQTSGEITGDYSHSVSYGAWGYYPAASFTLGAEDAAALLASAEATLATLRESGRREQVPARGGSQALDARRGVFVSLHQGDRLLGCVGNREGHEPLRTAVPALTLSAALDDPRFEPAAKAAGANAIDVELSVLSPMRRMRSPEQFHIGRHGAYLEVGARRGLLLPQVAEGRDWDADDFFRALSHKCGLGSAAWRGPKARLFCFEAQIIAQPGGGGH